MRRSAGQDTLGGAWVGRGFDAPRAPLVKFRHQSERDVLIRLSRDRVVAYFEPLGLSRRFVVTEIGKEPWPPVGDEGNPYE